MKRYTFLTRKVYDQLPDGRVRIYYDERVGTETVTHKDMETEEETTETYPVYSYRVADADSLERNAIIVALIRAKYTVDDELALHRQRETKEEEFAEYNTYVEWCKGYANRIIDQ